MTVMTAILPLNVAALRVNLNDQTNVAAHFKGATGAFSQMPWSGGNSQVASTGDQIYSPLEADISARGALAAGIHLHWELPDFFRRGVQSSAIGADVVFPPAPNRFLVIRYLSRFEPQAGYAPAIVKCWIVESDYLSASLEKDADGIARPAVSVPLPANPGLDAQPYRYMGRVLNYEAWDPASEVASDFLPSHQGPDGKALHLTSIGFLGAAFSSYYPDCRSVFGFWDHFGDQPDLRDAIQSNRPVQFKVSYQVIGWVQEPAGDPLAKIATEVRTEYDALVKECRRQQVEVSRTPAQVFLALAARKLRWNFRETAISCSKNADGSLASLTVPERTLCNGVIQELVWDMRENTGTTYFLATDNAASPAVFEDRVELAVGNTTAEALSALLKYDLGDGSADEDVLTNYELLLDALQLGLLRDLEQSSSKLIELDEQLHSRAFSHGTGGSLWMIEETAQAEGSPNPDSEITLPLPLAELLAELNLAQKNYDQGRAALLEARRQLFLDWFRYAKLNAGASSHVALNDLGAFLDANGPCELQSVKDRGLRVGLLSYSQAEGGQIVGLRQRRARSGPPSLAEQVQQRFDALTAALPKSCQLRNLPAPPFWQPTDPVLLVEGSKLSPVHRNGLERELPVRLGSELLTRLEVRAGGSTFSIEAASLTGLPPVTACTPMADEIKALIGEAALLVPGLASQVAAALDRQGGAGNPAAGAAVAAFARALAAAQGGSSQLEGGPGQGLFAVVRGAAWPSKPNPVESVPGPPALDFTFTNAQASGFAPDAVGWNTQQLYASLGARRVDPFLPVWLLWEVRFFPLRRDANQDYAENSLTGAFELDAHAVDYRYKTAGWAAADAVTYDSSVVLSRRPVFSLTAQIDDFLRKFPDDPAKDKLALLSQAYQRRKFLSQALSGFNLAQTLRQYVPRIAALNLSIDPSGDWVTPDIHDAAGADDDDDWYDFGWNGQAPIASKVQAQKNFGPFRAGYFEVRSLEVVDVFGQRMALRTAGQTPDGGLQAVAAASLKPESGDSAHAALAFLPPRLLAPTRLWFRWLSARHDNRTGMSDDFVEMSSHPATSPVCGWLLPNHLDDSLFFYDADGTPVGSFAVVNGKIGYLTRANHLDNPGSELSKDIGPRGAPMVNAHLASVMWSFYDRAPEFLRDLTATILASDAFISPASYAADPALSVLIGRPLALARSVLGLETLGGVLPVSQADTSPDSAFASDLKARRFDYDQRVAASSAKLGSVSFPVRLGNLTNLDDGLIGYFVEREGLDRYGAFFSSVAPAQGSSGVARPAADELSIRLNQTPLVLTLLIDPRAPVHATTGILPVDALAIPPDQYSRTMRKLAVTFFTAPLLERHGGLVPPLPQESGFDWQWVAPNAPIAPLRVSAANEDAAYGYGPQKLVEGWLQLTPAPPPPEEKQR